MADNEWGAEWSTDYGEMEILVTHHCDKWPVGSVDDARSLAAVLLRLADEGPPDG